MEEKTLDAVRSDVRAGKVVEEFPHSRNGKSAIVSQVTSALVRSVLSQLAWLRCHAYFRVILQVSTSTVLYPPQTARDHPTSTSCWDCPQAGAIAVSICANLVETVEYEVWIGL